MALTGIIRNNCLILLIFILGLALRVYNLGGESIWYDEAVSVAAAKLGILEQLRWMQEVNDNNPPLYYAVLHFWISLFGDSEFSSRLPSAIFGSLSVPAIYALGKLLFDKRTGLLAAFIMAISAFNIWFSQEARAYSLLALLAVLSFYFLLKLMVTGRRLHAAAYVLSAVCMAYSHYYGLLVITAQNIFCITEFIRHKRAQALGIKTWLVLQAVIGLSFLPCAFLLVRDTAAIQEGFWIPEPGLRDLLNYFITYSGSYYLLLLFLMFTLLSVFNPARLGELKSAGDIFKPAENYPTALDLSYRGRIYLLVIWLAAVVLIPFVISLLTTPVLIYRYTIAAAPAFYILASRGIVNLNNYKLILLAACLILFLSFPGLKRYYGKTDKYQWRETMRDIEADAARGDYILVYPRFEMAPAAYYLKREDLKLRPLSAEVVTSEDLEDGDVWLAVTTHRGIDKDVIKLSLSGRFRLISEKSYVALDLYQLRRK